MVRSVWYFSFKRTCCTSQQIVHRCSMCQVGLSKSHIKININSLCDKITGTYLPRQIVNLIEFMGKIDLFKLPINNVSAMNGK